MTKNLAKDTKSILNQQKLKPSKGLGQNFLIDRTVLKKIIQAADIRPPDVVLEIGPGTGTLTKELAKSASKVIAVEKDKKISEVLKNSLNDLKNIETINADILRTENLRLPKSYKIVANLPYYITSPVIRKFLESKTPPKLIVLMVQKEVAQRICAIPPNMNLLAISVQFYAKTEIVDYVSRRSFWPQPNVDSAVIKIIPRKKQKKTDSGLFFKIVKAGFSQPRKQIANNLSRVLKLDKGKVISLLSVNRIKSDQRAQSLSVADWRLLIKGFVSQYGYSIIKQ